MQVRCRADRSGAIAAQSPDTTAARGLALQQQSSQASSHGTLLAPRWRRVVVAPVWHREQLAWFTLEYSRRSEPRVKVHGLDRVDGAGRGTREQRERLPAGLPVATAEDTGAGKWTRAGVVPGPDRLPATAANLRTPPPDSAGRLRQHRKATAPSYPARRLAVSLPPDASGAPSPSARSGNATRVSSAEAGVRLGGAALGGTFPVLVFGARRWSRQSLIMEKRHPGSDLAPGGD